jgi:hypothetical protein
MQSKGFIRLTERIQAGAPLPAAGASCARLRPATLSALLILLHAGAFSYMLYVRAVVSRRQYLK